MNKEAIKETLTPIFRSVFKDEQLVITDETSAKDVERWDSLSHMAMISKVEETFKIRFKLKDLSAMKNVGDLISIVEQKLQA